jgi:hypothetical protein
MDFLSHTLSYSLLFVNVSEASIDEGMNEYRKNVRADG